MGEKGGAALRVKKWIISTIVILILVCSGTRVILGVEAAEGDEEGLSPTIIAHRAGATFAPENTIAALEQAICDGSKVAEIDVQQLRDGTLIVMHDSNFLRTANVDKNVWETDIEELADFEVGSAFSGAYIGEGIPTLEQMLQCADNRIVLMIELKYTGHENNLEESVLNLLRHYQMERSCIIGSMNEGILKRMKELDKDLATVFIAHSLSEEQYELDYADSYSIEAVNMNPEMVERIHAQNKPVYGWTVNSWEAIRMVLECGADGLVTDNVYMAQMYLWNDGRKMVWHW